MIEWIGILFIVLGLAFSLAGCFGLVRLPDVYNRLQAATKSVTLGTCSVLFGALILSGDPAVGLKCLLAIFFLLLTAPVAAHAISRGSHRGGVKLWRSSVMDAYSDDHPVTAPEEGGVARSAARKLPAGDG